MIESFKATTHTLYWHSFQVPDELDEPFCSCSSKMNDQGHCLNLWPVEGFALYSVLRYHLSETICANILRRHLYEPWHLNHCEMDEGSLYSDLTKSSTYYLILNGPYQFPPIEGVMNTLCPQRSVLAHVLYTAFLKICVYFIFPSIWLHG